MSKAKYRLRPGFGTPTELGRLVFYRPALGSHFEGCKDKYDLDPALRDSQSKVTMRRTHTAMALGGGVTNDISEQVPRKRTSG